MVDRVLAPDAVMSLPGSAADAVAWRSGGQLHLTVVAKATFAFASDAAMPRVEPQPILRAEVYHGNSPARSTRYGGDLAPYLDRADVLFTGHAHAPSPAPVQALRVRLLLFRGDSAVVDKAIFVQDGRGFTHLPIVYENAFGGPGIPDNPLGVGETAGSGAPLLLDPQDPRRPACFGPIARAWPARRALLGATPRKLLDGAIAEVPVPFDWSYFQAAPADQRTDFLRGDEWIMLEGLHPTLPLFRTRLPGARGVARIHGLSAFGVPEGHSFDLAADTLRIQGDEQRVTLVCRRSFPVSGEAALAAVRIVAGVSVGDEPIAWPSPPAGLAARPVPAAAPPAAQEPPVQTVMLTDHELPGGAPLPFVEAADRPSSASAAAAPLAPASGTQMLDALDDEETAFAPPERLRSEQALPFRSPGSLEAVPAPAPSAPVDRGAIGTLALPPEDDAASRQYEQALPFRSPGPLEAVPAPSPSGPVERVDTGTLAVGMFGGGDDPLPFSSAGPPAPPVHGGYAPAPAPVAPWPGVGEAWPTSERPVAKTAPSPSHVPYFDDTPPAAPPAKAPAPAPVLAPEPEPDPAAFPLERFAAIAAEIAEKRAPRDEVLRAHAIEERAWSAVERHWTAAIKKDTARGGKLQGTYDAAYVAAVEGFRGPVTAAEYARLMVAKQRKEVDLVLDALQIQRPALMCIIRLWTKRMAGDVRLSAEVNAALAAARAEP